MGFPGAHNVRRRPQGLRVAKDVSAPRIGDLASPTEHRTRRQNSARRSRTPAQNGTVGSARARQARRPASGLGDAANRCFGAGRSKIESCGSHDLGRMCRALAIMDSGGVERRCDGRCPPRSISSLIEGRLR